MIYADSSFLVSCCLADANTHRAKARLSTLKVPLPFTAFHELEVRNALQLCVFRGKFDASVAAAAWTNLQQDFQAGRLIRVDMNWRVAFRFAASLGRRHTSAIGTRSLDVLHVAAAKVLRVSELLTFDGRQAALAARVGLVVGP